MNENQNYTWEDIKAMFAETREQIRALTQREEEFYKRREEDYQKRKVEEQKRREEEQKRREEEQKRREEEQKQRKEEEHKRREEEQKRREEEQKRREEEQKRREEEQKRREEEQKRREEEQKQRKEEEQSWKEYEKKRSAELEKQYTALCKEVGGISKSNGDMAENFFFNAFRKDKTFMGEQYDRIHKGYFSTVDPYRNEYDIVLFNGKNIAIIEVKYKATPKNVKIEHLISRIDHFKKYAKEYKNHNIILGVAAMSFKSGLATELHDAGFVTIHPVGKKMMIYDKEAKVF
jgi:DNA mismatch repair ATPase MutL